MARKPRPRRLDPVFTEWRRAKLLRKRIPLAEVGSGLVVLVFLLSAAGWVRAQRDHYDPGERDLDMALLEARGARSEIYDRPVERFRDEARSAWAQAVDLGPFSPSVLAPGWAARRLQRFDEETLFEKINGQAEQYLKFDFRELTVLALEHEPSGSFLDLYLYEQGDFSNALGLLAEQRGDKPSVTLGLLTYTATSAGAFGAVGRFVFHLIGAPDGAPLRSQTRAALEALAGLAESRDLPRPYRFLSEGLALPAEAIGYSPVNAFQLSFAERFWFGTLSASPTTRAFVHEAEAEETALGLLERLVSAQEAELETISRDGRWVRLKHRFLGTFYALAVEGSTLYGVEDHPEPEALAAVMDRLRGALLRPESAPNAARSREAETADQESEAYSEEGGT